MIQLENISPLYFLQPIITIAFSAGLIVYWRLKRTFTGAAFGYSLLAYAGAIAIKIVLQELTYNSYLAMFKANQAALGVYFGLQTVFFEVGGAFLLAAWAVSRGKLDVKDAEGYGLGLAFWENAGYIGILGLLNLVTIYLELAFGGPTAQQVYSLLITSRPALFEPPSLVLIGYGVLERVTSLLFHLSWGYLCIFAAALHKRKYLLLALPMGFLDFFVPFASTMGLFGFELFIFILGLVALGLTILVSRSLHQK
jgi:hypothetical protein